MPKPKKADPFVGQSKQRKELMTTSFAGSPLEDASYLTGFHFFDEAKMIGVALDPEHCPVAESIKMALNADLVVVTRTMTYARVRERGQSKVLRWKNAAATKRIVEAVDRGESIPGDEMFFLLPPPPSERLGRRRVSKGPGSHSRPNGRNANALVLNGVRNVRDQVAAYRRISPSERAVAA